MAWSSAALSAEEQALFLADKPIVWSNALYQYEPDAVEWNTTGAFSGTDITDSAYPAVRAYDGYSDLPTRPDSAGTRYLLFDFSSNPIELDGWGFMQSPNGGQTLQIADSSDFTSNLQSVGFSSAGDREMDFTLGFVRYSGVPYVRLTVTAGGSIPSLGELFVLRRFQLPTHPLRPHNPVSTRSLIQPFTSESGVMKRYVRARNQFVLDATMILQTATHVSEAEAWWTRINSGANPFLWTPAPSSAPNDTKLVQFTDPDPLFPFERTAPNGGPLTLQALEQSPDFQANE